MKQPTQLTTINKHYKKETHTHTRQTHKQTQQTKTQTNPYGEDQMHGKKSF